MNWNDFTPAEQASYIDEHVKMFPDFTRERITELLSTKALFARPHDLKTTLQIACQIRDEKGWDAVEEYLAEQIPHTGLDEVLKITQRITWVAPNETRHRKVGA